MPIVLTLVIGAALALTATIGTRTDAYPYVLDRDTQRQRQELDAIRAHQPGVHG